MRRAPQLFLALLALFVLVSSASAVAANCAAGRAKFDTICRGCHSPDEKKGKSAADILNALAFQSAMEGLFPDFVNATDVENLAEYLFIFPAACPAAVPSVSATPTSASFGNVNVGETSASQTITLTNSGASNASGLTYSASNAAEFPVTKTCGSTLGFAAGSNTCTITISYAPSASGADSATYRITGANNVDVTISLDGTGVAAATPAETAIEYYHAGVRPLLRDRRSPTRSPSSTTARSSAGRAPASSSRSTPARRRAQRRVPLLQHRRSSPRARTSTRRDAPECTAVKANPNWMFEGEVFYRADPGADGIVPRRHAPGLPPVQQRPGRGAQPPLHDRLAVRNAMLAQGWIPEGYGPIGVIMCAPQ